MSSLDDLMERGDAIISLSSGQSSTTNNPTRQGSDATTVLAPESMEPEVKDTATDSRPEAGLFQRLSSALNEVINGKGVDTGLISRSYDKCPKGYPQLAAFIDTDENFMLYRRFGYLQARILLYKQDELRALEKKLDGADRYDAEHRPWLLIARERDDVEIGERKKLLTNIEQKFKEYAHLLFVARDFAKYNRPPDRDYESVRSFFDDEAPLVDGEVYAMHKADLVSLKPVRESTILDRYIIKLVRRFESPFVDYLFCALDPEKKSNTPKTGSRKQPVRLYRGGRIDLLVSMIITGFVLLQLMIPVGILWHLSKTKFTSYTAMTMFAILLAFTLNFTVGLSCLTQAKRHEVLTAAAAYCAVLVVFMGNVGQAGR